MLYNATPQRDTQGERFTVHGKAYEMMIQMNDRTIGHRQHIRSQQAMLNR